MPAAPSNHHGSIYRYRLEARRHRGGGPAPCQACREAYEAYRKRMKANALRRGDVGQFRHGTYYGYRIYKCKCDECKHWANWSRRNQRRKAAGRPVIPWRDDWKIDVPSLLVECERRGCTEIKTYPFLGGVLCEAHRPRGFYGTVVTHDDRSVR